jgi:myo-inositol-1(or 4)-monophosphatase
VVGTGAAGDKTLLADKAAEREIIETLSKFPDVRVLSEEAGEVGKRDSRYVAVVDPLDGSSNFERGLPFYCTSIAIADGERLPSVFAALVRDLNTGDEFYAEKGRGAWKNGKQIHSSGVTSIREAAVGIDLSRASVDTVVGLAPLVSSVKRHLHYGANALELCFVAEGKLEALVDLRGKVRVTDLAAAYLISKEAGAVLSDREGKELNSLFELEPRMNIVGSANASIHRQILESLRKT